MNIFEKHCWAEIDLDALRQNVAYIMEETDHTPLCGVVKADAYGHGDLAVAQTLVECGVSWLAVSSMREALRLRRGGIALPILILGYTAPELAATAAENDITLALPSLEWAKAVSALAAEQGFTVQCHLKLDTGMGRIGFSLRGNFSKAMDNALAAAALPGIRVNGAFQHFAVADCASENHLSYTRTQHMLFDLAVNSFRHRGLQLETVHCCNSAAQMLYPEWAGNLVRAGIILYGCNPSSEVTFRRLKQVMTLKSVVTHLKPVEAGRDISYGRTYSAPSAGKVATVAAGYADGYPRSLSNMGVVTIRGVACPVIGRVCMDQLMVDVTDLPEVAVGDEVILFGPDVAGDDVEAVAAKCGTISYEVLSQINRRVPRVYKENGETVKVVDYLE